MAEDKQEAPSSSDSAPKKSGGNTLIVILTLVNVLVSVGVLGLLAVSFQKQKEPQVADIAVGEGVESSEKGSEEANANHSAHQFGKVVTLDQFTVNLSSVGTVSPKFVRVNISIEVKTDDTEGEVGQKMARIRNTIIDLFNSKRPSDLANAEGRTFLKDEIKKSINSFLVTGEVEGVFFTNFALSG